MVVETLQFPWSCYRDSPRTGEHITTAFGSAEAGCFLFCCCWGDKAQYRKATSCYNEGYREQCCYSDQLFPSSPTGKMGFCSQAASVHSFNPFQTFESHALLLNLLYLAERLSCLAQKMCVWKRSVWRASQSNNGHFSVAPETLRVIQDKRISTILVAAAFIPFPRAALSRCNQVFIYLFSWFIAHFLLPYGCPKPPNDIFKYTNT